MVRDESWDLPHSPRVADVVEVRRLGARVCRARTADQTAAAIFWSAPPHLPWSIAAAQAARLKGLDVRDVKTPVVLAVEAARRLARRIGERMGYPTPQALIRGEARSRIATMHVDSKWEPLLVSAGPPAPSEACVAAGAAVAQLRALLEDDQLFVEAIFPQPRGVARRFRCLTEMLQECEDAQVWGGLHLRETAVESTQLGLAVGAKVT